MVAIDANIPDIEDVGDQSLVYCGVTSAKANQWCRGCKVQDEVGP
jgi:hypothetical protein